MNAHLHKRKLKITNVVVSYVFGIVCNSVTKLTYRNVYPERTLNLHFDIQLVPLI